MIRRRHNPGISGIEEVSTAQEKDDDDWSRKNLAAALDRDNEISVEGDVAVGHARSVEREAGITFAIEEDEAAGAVSASREQMDRFASSEVCGRFAARRGRGGVFTDCRPAQKIDGGLGHHDFHDGFAIAGAGDAAGFGIGVAATADQRRIADAAGKFAARAAGGSGGKQMSISIDGDGADGSLFMSPMKY